VKTFEINLNERELKILIRVLTFALPKFNFISYKNRTAALVAFKKLKESESGRHTGTADTCEDAG
jgi:hypothetical protein